MNIPDRLTTALEDRYRIERELGAGGMATVFLAADLKHDRKVAIKVLKPELAAVLGAERFVQEIKTTAALSHPHILPLFDSGEAGGFLYYVMPYIEGETIRERLNRETQLSVDEALRITREIADALDYAHRHGVIHRDIKPENILLHDGRAMVMDFGIALAVSAAAGGRMTETGLSLGTPHYMSPEQATADKDLTARSDVYSLASVCFEMLAGEPPHGGGSAQAIIMKIIAEPAPRVDKLRRNVPAHVTAALATALEKVPADRFATARAFSDALGNVHYRGTGAAVAAVSAPSGTRRIERVALAVASVTVVALAAWIAARPTVAPPVVAYRLATAGDALPDDRGPVAITSDGEQVIYAASGGVGSAVPHLWIKRRDSVDAVLIPGTDLVTAVAVSPNNQSLALIRGRSLTRVNLSGGASTVLARQAANVPRGVAWLEDGTILYVAHPGRMVRRVSSEGGEVDDLWSSDTLNVSGLAPLPGSSLVLFTGCAAPCAVPSLWALDLKTRSATFVTPDIRFVEPLPNGELLLVSSLTQVGWIASFDPRTLSVGVARRPVLDSVGTIGASSYLALSKSGTLVYRRGAAPGSGIYELVSIDRTGRVSAIDSSFSFRLTATAGDFGWRVSPDGRSLAIGLRTESGDDVWRKALPRGSLARVTFGQTAERRPSWTADGQHIVFVADDGVYLRRADGAGGDSLLLRGELNEASISADGRWLIVRRGAQGAVAGGRDILVRRLDVADTLTPLLATEFDEHSFELSPDGRWIVYVSNESGRDEVLVRPFPDVRGAKLPVSVAGGAAPRWSRDGLELYYVDPQFRLMAARFRGAASPEADEPQALFELPRAMAEIASSWFTPYDVTPDGRFVMVRSTMRIADESILSVRVIENWLSAVQGTRR
ncbi:protein kinase [Pseudogemmatithrix spongiicola]|uniref:non-specific serine/threonine protein kinase n=1 Tax=Pseudogemmatithrix spongiicola TaxID=3062599 RepID=A0AA49JT24_9BACT|nr:protein kinase [Gemmatimonadaceae bacterium 'strain 138']WKW14300.1 protein kinase [Gemmatimonadaceae bacterium 'strain 318']